KNILKSLVPLSLLNELAQELEHIKKEERIVPIFEFNGLLQEQIKDEPAPFIYERLGERYKHYFIDEFQDTSTMQWANLVPLIENAVVQERLDGTRGSLMLVGDAKQSIYRWRGGDADQFLNILGSDNLFSLPILKEPLPKNYRSTDAIVHFNNDFFSLYGTALNGEVYKDLYEYYLKQEVNDIPNGYVQIDFLDPDEDEQPLTYGNDATDLEDEVTTIYPPHVLRQVKDVLEQGYNEGDICVLVRTHKQGNEIAKYLIKNEIEVVSGESLQVAISPRVQLLECFMQLYLKPNQQEPRYRFLMAYLQLNPQEDIQQFVGQHINKDLKAVFNALFGNQNNQAVDAFSQVGLFEAAEIVANAMGLFDFMDTRLQTFMEFIYSFASGYEASLNGFMEHWETKKDKLSVPATANPRAVQIMTIHKAKGLEFPVVIVPYCDMKLDYSREAAAWIPVDPKYYEGFEFVYMSLKSENVHYGAAGENKHDIAAVYEQHIAKTQMDHINTLYVAFTRAAEQLYVLCIDRKNKGTSQSYSSLLSQFVENKQIDLEAEQGFKVARIGTQVKKEAEVSDTDNLTTLLDSYDICVDPQRVSISTRKGMLWASGADVAIHKGNVLHEYLAQLSFHDELPNLIQTIKQDNTLPLDEQQELISTLEMVLSREYFGSYFSKDYDVKNEHSILMPDGTKLIPDRLLFDGSNVTIIDYKTGAQLPKHKTQLETYAQVLSAMGYKVVKKVLLYTDKMIEVSWQ
ncbi:MAG: UvrD-helicase domain-containing protein, partial [Nonlabens sp.]|nr:UvrD-helicase domain-containing protein [Nonlabens sp.]